MEKEEYAAQPDLPAAFNAASLLIDRHLAEGRGDKAAILTAERAVTYRQLVESVNRFGNTLLAEGIEPGERVLMVIKDCPEFYFVFWGCIKSGIIPIPVNTMLRVEDYRFIIADGKPRAVVFSEEFAEAVRGAAEGVRLLPLGSYMNQVAAGAPSDLATRQCEANSDCFWLYSSGTTGAPKGIAHTHAHILATCRLFAVGTIGCEEADIFFAIPRLFFAYGLGWGMNFPLWVGGTAVLDPRRPTPETAVETIRRFRPTTFAAVPTFYAALLAAAGIDPQALSSLRRCISGGEALPPALQHRWRQLVTAPILDGIGSTEALNTFISNSPAGLRDGSSGRLVRGYQAKILDDAGVPVGDGDVGRLWVNGPSITTAYRNNPEKTKADIVDGWINTGDTFRRDEDGYYYYCGRNDDMLKVGGIWVSPFEIESALATHAKVLEAAVVGRADPAGLIKPEAWVVLRPSCSGTDDLAEEIRRHCRQSLAPYKYPRWVRFVSELPKTATGKIKRYVLRSASA